MKQLRNGKRFLYKVSSRTKKCLWPSQSQYPLWTAAKNAVWEMIAENVWHKLTQFWSKAFFFSFGCDNFWSARSEIRTFGQKAQAVKVLGKFQEAWIPSCAQQIREKIWRIDKKSKMFQFKTQISVTCHQSHNVRKMECFFLWIFSS